MYAQGLLHTPSLGAYIVNGDRTGRAGNGYSHIDAGSHDQGEGVSAGAKRTYGAAQGRRRSAGKGGHREQGSNSLGSGAQALREYACDASPKRQTVHVIVRLQMKDARYNRL
eukprot:6214020-Pleurochrysis_carterae.AAC.1